MILCDIGFNELISDRSLPEIATFKKLKYLCLDYTAISMNGLAFFANKNFQNLYKLSAVGISYCESGLP